MESAGRFFAFLALCLLNGSSSTQSPRFRPSTLVTLNQNALANKTVTVVHCDYSGSLSYDIIQITPNVTFLSVNVTSGEVRLSCDAYLVPNDNYTVSVRCFDTSNVSYYDLSLLLVARVEQNEFAPVFSAGQQVALSFFENTSIGAVLAVIAASDADRGEYGYVTYAVQQTSVPTLFAVNASTGALYLMSGLDYEASTLHQIIISALNPPDGAGVARSTSILVIVQVINVNDEAPIFSRATYTAAVPETSLHPQPDGILSSPRPPPGFLLISCTDLDTSMTSITYAMGQGNLNVPFNVDQRTGSLSAAQDLDYETQTMFNFSVACYDNGLPNLTNTAAVIVSVLPVNEYNPVVYPETFFILVTEDTLPGTLLASVKNISAEVQWYHATDGDAGADGQLMFTITGPQSLVIDVNSTTGDIVLIEAVDTDRVMEYVLSFSYHLTVCDASPPRFDCPRISITIIISATNDNYPTFSQTQYQVQYNDGTPPGQLIYSTCTDADFNEGALSRVIFDDPTLEITEAFDLSEVSGNLTTKVTMDYESAQGYTIYLQCMDTGGLMTFASVMLTVLPINDNAPVFQMPWYHFNVSRTTPVVSAVGLVKATDADIDVGSIINYSVSTNRYFAINNNGLLLLVNSICLEQANNITVLVSAYDGLFSTSVRVTLSLTPGNLYAPTFIIGQGIVTEIDASSPVGRAVTTLKCADMDGPDIAVTYMLLTGDGTSVFQINPRTGTIEVARSLALNVNASTYLLNVQCADDGVPSLSDTTTIIVRVSASKPTVPPSRAVDDVLYAFVSKAARVNDIVLVIQAADLNITGHSFHFSITAQTIPNAFIIDSSTGIVRVASSLEKDDYTVMVLVETTPNAKVSEPAQQEVLKLVINTTTCDPLRVKSPSSPTTGSESSSIMLGVIMSTTAAILILGLVATGACFCYTKRKVNYSPNKSCRRRKEIMAINAAYNVTDSEVTIPAINQRVSESDNPVYQNRFYDTIDDNQRSTILALGTEDYEPISLPSSPIDFSKEGNEHAETTATERARIISGQGMAILVGTLSSPNIAHNTFPPPLTSSDSQKEDLVRHSKVSIFGETEF